MAMFRKDARPRSERRGNLWVQFRRNALSKRSPWHGFSGRFGDSSARRSRSVPGQLVRASSGAGRTQRKHFAVGESWQALSATGVPAGLGGPRTDLVGASVTQNAYKLLRCAFGKAVKWEVIKRNPFDLVEKPKRTYRPRDIWDADTIRKALDECRHSRLYVAMNLSFACSLRVGEILGLTWDNIHISAEDIAADNAHLFVEKELQRASLAAIRALDQKDVYFMFPAFKPNATTRLVLKKPKTESSVRKVWIPKTLAYILLEYRKSQESMKRLLGDEYYDHNLVVALPNGRPCEERLIAEAFQRLRDRCGLPSVQFSSTTYKLKLNRGDIKATQGDTGHSQADMVTRVYAHILDEDRKVNAVKMEQAF